MSLRRRKLRILQREKISHSSPCIPSSTLLSEPFCHRVLLHLIIVRFLVCSPRSMYNPAFSSYLIRMTYSLNGQPLRETMSKLSLIILSFFSLSSVTSQLTHAILPLRNVASSLTAQTPKSPERSTNTQLVTNRDYTFLVDSSV